MASSFGTVPDTHRQATPLSDLSVLVLAADGTAGLLAGSLLADLGAEVTGSESPGGFRARLATEAAQRPDVVIVDEEWSTRLAGEEGSLALLQQRCPEVVMCVVTGFGLSGPLAGRETSDLLLQAVTGLASTNGYRGEPPLCSGIPVPTVMGALAGVQAVLAALLERRRSGRGQLLDIAMFDATICCLGTLLPSVFRTGEPPSRIGNRHQMTAPWNAYPTTDGWIVISTMGESLWAKLADLIGRPQLVDDPRFVTTSDRVGNADELDQIIGEWTRVRSSAEVRRACERRQIPVGRISSVEAALADPAVRNRVMGAPGSPAAGRPRLPIALYERPASDAVRPGAVAAGAAPLDGLRVLELGAFTAGPLAGRLLGALGADVLKVEPPKGENSRHLAQQVGGNGYLFYLNNTDKRGAVAELDRASDRDQVLALARAADVLLTNLSDELLRSTGLDLGAFATGPGPGVYCAITGYGHAEGRAGEKAFDTVVQGEAGVMALTGWPEGPPLKIAISWADVLGAAMATLGILAAVLARSDERAGGAALVVDVALLDGAVWSTQHRWKELALEGSAPARLGNRHPVDAPHGFYPSADGWVAIHVRNQAEWGRLASLIGADSELSLEQRRSGDALDALVRAWTSARTSTRAVDDLRRAGVPAEPSNDLVAVAHHPHTAARALLVTQVTPSGEPVTALGTPWKFSRSPVGVRRAAPNLAHGGLTW